MIVNLALACLVISIALTVYRVLKGPTWGDRIMALDFLAVNVAVLIVVLALRLGSTAFLDAALIVSILGFLSTVALSRYVLAGKVIE